MEVFSRRGCDSLPQGLSVEIPFGNKQSITLGVLLSYRYSSVRLQYSVLHRSLSTGKKLGKVYRYICLSIQNIEYPPPTSVRWLGPAGDQAGKMLTC